MKKNARLLGVVAGAGLVLAMLAPDTLAASRLSTGAGTAQASAAVDFKIVIPKVTLFRLSSAADPPPTDPVWTSPEVRSFTVEGVTVHVRSNDRRAAIGPLNGWEHPVILTSTDVDRKIYTMAQL